MLPCDVQSDADLERVFQAVRETYGRLDFLIHSIAFAPPEDLRKPYVQSSRAGWHLAMDISVYSLVAACRLAAPLMDRGGSIVTLSYYGGEKVMPGYNMMGRVQSGPGAFGALPGLGPGPAEDPRERHQRRPDANAQRRRHFPVRRRMRDHAAEKACMGRNVEFKELATTGLYLLGELSSGVTGEVIHVDCGYSIVGL